MLFKGKVCGKSTMIALLFEIIKPYWLEEERENLVEYKPNPETAAIDKDKGLLFHCPIQLVLAGCPHMSFSLHSSYGDLEQPPDRSL